MRIKQAGFMRLAGITVAVLMVSCFTGCLFNFALSSTGSGLDASFSADTSKKNDAASAYGKYSVLISTHTVPEDVRVYGSYSDYGYWPGGTYRGVPNLPAGYWVYVEPVWYIWKVRN